MSEHYRPSAEQLALFAGVAKQIRVRPDRFLDAAQWFESEFSLRAIDERKEAALHPGTRAQREQFIRDGYVFVERSDKSAFMERLLRATERLLEIDDSAFQRAARDKHYRRVVLVAALITDPDLPDEVPEVAHALKMERAHWPAEEQLTVAAGEDFELDRWWARNLIFDPRSRVYEAFQPLVARALDSLSAGPVQEAEAKPSGYYSVADLARRHSVDAERLRKRLDRWRPQAMAGNFIEDTERGRRQPAYLYLEEAVMPVINALKAAGRGEA